VQHLLNSDDLSADDVHKLMDTAAGFLADLKAGKPNTNVLADKIILMMFYENSTRTLTSFDMAAKRLGAQVVVWNPEISSVHKNETFTDTVDVLAAMNPDGIVIRHSEYGAPGYVAGRVKCPVINGGDSWREHPTQALVDAFTILQHKEKLEGLRVAICGDVAHSRVANSNAVLLTNMGAEVRIVAPEFLLPQKLPIDGVETFADLDEGIESCDVVMMLRIQKERMEMSLIPDTKTYFKTFGLTKDRLKKAKPEAIVMHPGPINRGVEISDEMADDPKHSVILQQAANGVPVRMAVLSTLLTC
jgi:aspartate carbamoyltransferase catalytic subunit